MVASRSRADQPFASMIPTPSTRLATLRSHSSQPMMPTPASPPSLASPCACPGRRTTLCALRATDRLSLAVASRATSLPLTLLSWLQSSLVTISNTAAFR
ncbi:hypothetical protein BN1708_017517 [Verticillium longisporum]|uniref:Uncharacterized protein n=1 Tax=Verticillium longisporum TaxID=100787 RepID=A0A0G4L4C6_VERLO|nr:hypothetical protein BN1708_017517 [Verticillium longisporum]